MNRKRWITAVVAVALLGGALLVAVPAVLKYRWRVKTAEASMNIRQMFDGSVGYFTREHDGYDGKRMFPKTVGPTPDAPFCRDGSPLAVAVGPETFSDPTWKALGFAPTGELYFRYIYRSQGAGLSDASFSAWAVGDLDCDGVPTTYERWHSPADLDDCNVSAGRGLAVLGDEDEGW